MGHSKKAHASDAQRGILMWGDSELLGMTGMASRTNEVCQDGGLRHRGRARADRCMTTPVEAVQP
jgi:hypothetical protein